MMIEEIVFLKSLHPYNFRHGKENAKVIGFGMFKPNNLPSRPCFRVKYESDGYLDYISHESVVNGHWKFTKREN